MRRGTPPTRRLVLASAGALLLPRAARAQLAKHRRIATLGRALVGGRSGRCSGKNCARSATAIRSSRSRPVGRPDTKNTFPSSCGSPPKSSRRRRTGAGGQACDLDDPDRHCRLQRSGRRRDLCQPRASGRQCHRAVEYAGGHCGEGAGAAQGCLSRCRARCRPGQPRQPDPRRRAGGRATSGPNSAHRAPTGRGPRSRPGRSRSFPR
jgi:hypothetical protein